MKRNDLWQLFLYLCLWRFSGVSLSILIFICRVCYRSFSLFLYCWFRIHNRFIIWTFWFCFCLCFCLVCLLFLFSFSFVFPPVNQEIESTDICYFLCCICRFQYGLLRWNFTVISMITNVSVIPTFTSALIWSSLITMKCLMLIYMEFGNLMLYVLLFHMSNKPSCVGTSLVCVSFFGHFWHLMYAIM